MSNEIYLVSGERVEFDAVYFDCSGYVKGLREKAGVDEWSCYPPHRVSRVEREVVKPDD